MRKYLVTLVVLGLLVFGNALFNGFVWDDEEMILLNPAVHSLANLLAFFSGSTFNSGGAGSLSGLYYKPLMITTFSILYTIFGPNAAVFHLGQILIHLANASFLFLVLYWLFKSPLIPFTVSLIFLVHPINTETVVYIADYQEVLFFFFGIISLWYLLTKPAPKILWLSLLLAASFLSKETGLVMAAISAVAVFLFAKDRLKTFLWAALVAFGTYCLLRFAVAGIFFNKHGLTSMSTAPFPQRLINLPAIIFFYLKTFFYPAVLSINQQWIVTRIDFRLVATDLLFFAALVAGFVLSSSKRLYFLFLVWFLAGLGLHLQIFPLDLTVSDRWFYLPMIGLLVMLTITFKKFLTQPLILGTIVTVLSLSTFIRTFDWRDGFTLYGHDIKNSPDAFDLQNNYGVELFRRGDFSQAKIHFEKSVTLSPQWWTNWNNLGAIAEREKNYSLARQYYQKAIDNGHYYLAYENMAKLLYFHFTKAEAKSFAREALRFLPYNQTLQAVAFED